MKLLFFSGSLKAGGAERSLSRLVNFLVENGHEVHVVLRLDIIMFTLHPDVRVHILENYRGRNKAITTLKLRKRLASKISEIGPDTVCAYSSLAGVLLASTFKANTIVRFDTYPRSLRPWKQALFYTFYNLPHLKHIVCLTEDTKKDLRNVLPINDIVVIYNASVPTQPKDSMEAAGSLPTDRPYLVSLGRMSRAKRYTDALEAYISGKVYEQLDFVLIGDGVERQRLEAQANAAGVADHVHFLGYQEDPFPVLRNARYLIHTSEREGFPNVFVEALSHNVPVIATDCKSGPSEIITDGENGFLVPVGDIKAIADKMSLLARDEQLRATLAANARMSIHRFSEEVVYQQWLEILTH